MTKKIFTLREDQTLHVAKEVMDWARIRHVPIVDRKKRLVGMITHRYLMATDLETLGPGDSVQETARIMRTKKIGAIPIVGEDETLVGILSEADLLRLVELVV